MMHSKETEEIDRHIELALAIAKTDNKRAIASLELTLERSRSINYLHGIAPVSYTHLDVYKRQPFHSIVLLQMLLQQ